MGIPPGLRQSIVIHAVETGGVPSSGNTKGGGGAGAAGQGSLVQEVIHAAYSAFLRRPGCMPPSSWVSYAFLVLSRASLFAFVTLGQ